MILPLGPQNAFVMNQGIRRQYHLMIALLCAISDLLLICAGIFGGSAPNPLNIKDAKAGLALYFGVSEDDIQITING